MTNSILNQLETIGVIPVVEIEHADHAVPLARALKAAGLPTMEVTLRTAAALEAIERISDNVDDFLVGAGTLLTEQNVSDAIAAGAAFGVSPGLDVPVATTAIEAGFPFVPGTITPSEVLAAVRLGFTKVKFFPAGQYGGASTLSALSSPLAATGVSFMPTGGVRLDNLGDYLGLSSVFAVGGTWIATKALITGEQFETIETNARQAAEAVATIRRK
ncbi:bifunctional 4-hydroxy-2-oxoglutarate aldolase/2-dehydro-3-deoxy-phosphogluconate aldolase [Lysinibacter cavernae]|uniref:2-dehydro-3-deoxy-phosphogluconate aldolase n=1 Tax=Lysinibacter cavernae TaxID=1640652 RepID=A0A7X5R151_9MICO|nr:bifunctional 4-hydroxy-2-oxoglutarate aldolase/2-dehydro-3-deoxy-phosphogluconate aldolase [Lysinibacter cavernae]NIH53592.1 2-dehydro-3-deoxyphosphogluconate aldolase/(4S)-4-hydroxy-2-oxoglutarate aldolase [Lysinibacter cavernae]